MSIQTLRGELKDIPGAERLTMQYDEGGKVQVFSIDQLSVRVGPTASAAEIKEAFLKALKQ